MTKVTEWRRSCPNCGRELYYSNSNNLRLATNKGGRCRSCSASRGSGPLNPFYGKKHSSETKERMSQARFKNEAKKTPEEARAFKQKMQEVWREHHEGKPRKSVYQYQLENHGKEYADQKLADFRSATSRNNSGTGNPMYGKPAPKLSGTGWQGHYLGRWFRSSRELQFMLNNPTAVTAESNKFRAKYTDWEGTPRTTVPDFFVEDTGTVYECKPARLHKSPSVVAKVEAQRTLASTLGYKHELVDPGVVDYDQLTELIRDGSVVLHERTRKKYEEWPNRESLS